MRKTKSIWTTEINSILNHCLLTLIVAFVSINSYGSINPNSDSASLVIDINNDGKIEILVLGTNSSINGAEAFSPNLIAEELENILEGDATVSLEINVIAEDIHLSKLVTLGLGGNGSEYTWMHHSHSLAQYYYWPEKRETRMDNLSGKGMNDWDYVVIAADPYIVQNTPGYYAFGVNKIAGKVAEGGALPLLLMMWAKDSKDDDFAHFEEFTYRTADGAGVEIKTLPAGLAWQSLPDDIKDTGFLHPTPNGAYLSAATIFSEITCKSASLSEYAYNDAIADIVSQEVLEQKTAVHYSGVRTFLSPFKSCDIGDDTIIYNHTGSSSENGIRGGLNWIFNMKPEVLQNGGEFPISFNYGRANTNFEPNKRYQINPDLFDFSFGFPMQDHGNHGDVSMLYGMDKRDGGTLNDTDLGVARYMIEQSELPYARAIPIRTLFAQMKEMSPERSAYRDAWHMHRDLDKAVGAYMYTILTGKCALGIEPQDQTSDNWKTWMANKIGFETAWNFMYLQAIPPPCAMIVDNDKDGFNDFVDCDDNNKNINPGNQESPYNGIDDDCNPLTLDDDLDADGFVLVEDCDDGNADINPDATEIPNNGIDEDCDGSDMISSVFDLDNSIVKVFPNPTSDVLKIEISKGINYNVFIFDLKGKLLLIDQNVSRVKVNHLPEGTYVIEIQNLMTKHKVVGQFVKI